jgi:large subunit ribosomal protein L7/L12
MSSKNLDKMVDEIVNKMSMLEIAELVKKIEETTGVSAAMPVASAAVVPTGEAPAQAEEKAEYKVTLQESGPEKIKTIKALRQVVSTLSLTDAKNLVEGVPSVIVEAAPKDDAKKIKETLEAAGAKVQLS